MSLPFRTLHRLLPPFASFGRTVLVISGLALLSPPMVDAKPPAYVVLRAPAPATPGHPAQSHSPNRQQEVSAQSYAYGWFGVQPRRHWSRHYGYFRNFTEWSAK